MKSTAPDLLSLVLEIRPPKRVTLDRFTGLDGNHFVYNFLESEDAPYCQRLHDANDRKPFTCSPLIHNGHRYGVYKTPLRPEQPLFMRITGVDAEFNQRMLNLINRPPPKININHHPFDLVAVHSDPEKHHLACATTYEAFATPYLLGQQKAPTKFGLRYLTPTTFRVRVPQEKGYSCPVPMPDWVFGGLLDQWNRFGHIPIDKAVKSFITKQVVLTKYQLETKALRIHRGSLEVGCIGEANYVILKQDRYWGAIIQLLTAYSFFAGVGYQTTAGMGQVERL